MTPDEEAKALKHLRKFAKKPCLFCGSTAWEILDVGSVSLRTETTDLQYAEPDLHTSTSRSVPVILVCCKTCCFLATFAARPILA